MYCNTTGETHSFAGQMVSGLTAIPESESEKPTHSEQDLSTTDDFILVGSTLLLESFSQALLVRNSTTWV